MLGNVELISPDGDPVIASPEAAEILREQGYTDAPPEAPPAPDPAEPQDPPQDDPPEDPEGPDDLQVQDPAAPRGNASREAWAAYAEQIGLQVVDEDTREDIKAAVADLEK